MAPPRHLSVPVTDGSAIADPMPLSARLARWAQPTMLGSLTGLPPGSTPGVSPSCIPDSSHPMDTTQFLSALLAIIVIDLVLAGDNAIVIALAARRLPAHLQRRAIMWGAAGAIVVRSLMTVIVVWLLKIPGLLLVGGALLVWIGYRLLMPDEHEEGEHEGAAATTFWGAMRTIVIADAVMGLDNVLAVAGAAHGSYVLVVLGLLISIPIVIWGSTMILKSVGRYPSVIYVGAAVLLLTAVKMMSHEPLLKAWLETRPVVEGLAYLLIPVVLWLGFVKNHRYISARIDAKITQLQPRMPMGSSSADSVVAGGTQQRQAEPVSLKVLVPIDGTDNGLNAAQHAMKEYQRDHALEIHLLNVRPFLSQQVARFVSRDGRKDWHQGQAMLAMSGASSLLKLADVPHHRHWAVGDRAAEICRMAEQLGVHHLVMGTARKNSFTRMLEDSVTNGVLDATTVPVEIVTGAAVSPWERWGLIAVIGAAAALGLILAFR